MKRKLLSSMLAAAVVVTSTFSTTSVSEAKEPDASNGKVEVTMKDNSVTIGNDAIERTFSTADSKLSTTEIVNKRTDGGETNFTPEEGSEEFIVKTTKEKKDPISLEPIDRKGWTAEADSYQNGAAGASDGPASNLLDGKIDTIWHSNYGGGTNGAGDQDYPHNVVIKFDDSETFQSFSYTPRKESETTNGNIKGYKLYASTEAEKLDFNSDKWGEPIAEGEFEYDGTNPIYVNLKETCTATQIKFVATSSNNGEKFAGGAEFNLHKDKVPVVADDRAFKTSDLQLEDGKDAVKVEDTTATINGEKKTGKKVTFSFEPYTHKGVEYTIDEVVVMYEGDYFMRKYLEIEVPDEDMGKAEIDYIDLESLKVEESDKQWTIPRGKGGIVQMEEFKANLGQPIYIQGMFFGCEFPAADTEIVDETGYMRYYTGKTFERMKEDNQLTTDGKYVTWQTVAGAARSTENEVIQADFYDYIDSIATPSEFRIQYNSWFDNMMKIDDENILESFIEIDRELNNAEVRPLDSYVVDDGWNAYNDGTLGAGSYPQSGSEINKEGFWTFNEKFPDELTPSSELVQKFGSNFGVWVGPRGGYNFYGTLANIIEKAGNGSKAGGSIDVADRVYVEKFKDMAIDWQKRFKVNYWKWDGFADTGQYNHFNTSGGADGVPVYSETNHHMTGGYHQMYHVTDLWEAWIDLMEAVRQSEKEDGINNLWISLTCYVNPSPWYLQWANSVWIQCTHDQKDAGFGTTKMNKQITYRDACYYDFLKNHEFQFPLQNIYNHDPVYGKEGTGMNVNTATDEDFQNYLYMLSTRGTAFWELYYSDSIMTDGKYEITGEFLEWAEENYHMLKNSKMIGGRPDNTTLGSASSSEASAEAYGFSCFDGKEGIISLRNPSASADKEIKFTFDRTIGVAEGAGTLDYYLEHSYKLSDESAQTGTLTYGQEYTVNLKPNEVRILRVSAQKDTKAPEIDRIMTDGNCEVTVKFNEKVSGNLFAVDGSGIASIEKSADDTTYHITLTKAPEDGKTITVTPKDIKDMSGNATTASASVVYHKGNVVVENKEIAEAGEIAAADKSLNSNNGFSVAASVNTTGKDQTLVKQNDQYELKVTADGKASFTLNGATAVSGKTINDGKQHVVVGVKENNGMLKLYVDGSLEGSDYKEGNRYHKVEKAAITVGNDVSKAGVYDTAYGYDKVDEIFQEGFSKLELTNEMITVSGTEEGDKNTVLDKNNTTFWTSQKVSEGTVNNENAWLKVDLGATYKLDQVDYTPRFDNVQNNYWECTGNIKNLIVETSVDGETWTAVTEDGGRDLSKKIVKENNSSFFPEEITFEAKEARYVRISGTKSHHWQTQNVDKQITVADLAIYGEKAGVENIATDSSVKVEAKWTKDDTDAAKGGDRPMSMVVDGNKADTNGNYGEFGADDKAESSYMQIDLGEVCDVDTLNLYRYWNQNRVYDPSVILVAEKEADFKDGTATVVYNADKEKIHGLNDKYYTEVKDETYEETAQGKSWNLPENTKARFVRVYMHGVKNGGDTNHIVEMEVIGTRPDKEEVPAVDLTKLIERLTVLAAVDTSNATTDSAAAFKALVKEGYDLVASGAKTQGEVDAMLKKLEGAENKLVDTNALKKAIADAEKKVAESTKTSAAATLAKIEEAKALLKNGTTETMNQMIKALEDAMKTLVARGDVKELKALIDTYEKEELKEADYTTSTWSAYETALNTANAIVKDNSDSDQTQVDAAKKALEDAHKALEKRGDTDALKALVEKYKDLKEADYTHDTWVVFKEAFDAAKAIVADNSDSTQAQVDAAKEALENAYNALKEAPENPKLDTSRLEKAIADAKAVVKESYTTDSYNAMKAVLDEAEDLLKEEAQDQDTIDAKTEALNAAIEALVKRGDVKELSELVKAYEEEKLNEGVYTTSTWSVYQTAFDAAKAIIKDNSNSDQEKVDAAKTALEVAKEALEERGNTDSLKELVTVCEELKEEDFTADTWKVFENALDAAKAIVADNSDSNQTQVDAAKEALQKAKDDLKEAEKPVNRSKLEEAYNKYKDLKNDGYTENSWKTFKNALDAAKAVLEYEDATAEQVDAALAQLEKAVSGLKKAPIDGSGNNQGAQNNNQKPSTGGSGSNGSVKTGDSSDVMLWGIFAAAALMAGVVVKKKKA
ncbi:discoidin domain-containing protein [Coprococcus sp. LG100-32]|uniref:discoidin domain-containing protein n=1 Tax=Coprococcus sp. LG100-32 TaxID=2997994 RepID=UPI0022E2BF96|nr:discoidin domain-containing protein [Coprococcus sp. LG100-32]